MKTTIDLPEEILHRAKVVAAQRKTTLKDLVIQGLDYAMNQPPISGEIRRLEKAQRLLDALRAENTSPMQPLTREQIHDREFGR